MNAIKTVMISIFNWIHAMDPVKSFGLDIILFTLLLKLVLLPLNIQQTKSTMKTQAVQPKLKALQDKYKNDPKKLQEAQMELYKTEGVNPFGGCLPLLIQWPILIAVFYVFREYQFGDASFIGLPLNPLVKQSGVVGLIFAAISGLTTYISTKLLTPKNQEANAMTSNSTNLIMSAMFMYFSYTVKGSLAMYWIINNILQMGIQYLLNKSLYKKTEKAAAPAK